ncbi:MAG: 3-hydroxyacyl-CoA dehydrogenase NAD-binding domain-containing protein [Melioribacteraceae bacterium]|nr:3-hydroxyacyl-CoA dehydrogenase NAD-binding domain-containing protein [Melioribacteraceae bacterium]
MKRIIRKVVVLGSGVMGSRIASHFANIGCEVSLLDIVPKELTEKEKSKGLTLNDVQVRNRIADENLAATLKAKPSPIYHKSFTSRIRTGNFEDNMDWLKDSDWTIEVVVENLKIKKLVFDTVEKFRKPGTLITSNTSGIPIQSMLEGRSDDFIEHFCGTHFFNPPRYLQLLEIVPSDKTKEDVIDFLMQYGDLFLGKTTVLCKDTPSFIANRIGVFSIMAIFKLMQEMNLTIEEVDSLTGPITGKPKSATFRTSDIVGIDTLVKVATNNYNSCPDDEQREIMVIPDFVNKLVEKNWLGDKTGQGFYKKSKNEKGERVILTLDTDNFEYREKKKAKFGSVGAAKVIDNLGEGIKSLHYAKDKAGDFLRELSYYIFSYSSNRIPEITDELYKVDDAMRAGFGWELGPFETWDILGVEKFANKMEEAGHKPAAWVKEMLENGITSFYTIVADSYGENGVKKFYDLNSKSYKKIVGKESFIILDNIRSNKPVWKNSGTTLHDIGDGVLNLEFQTKMNAIGGEVIEGINKAIDIAEKDFRGLVLGNDGQHFSAGANLAMILMLSVEQDWDELEFVVRQFQNTMMRIRYSGIPVVAAPHGMALGGGCETCLHADQIVASAETYIGLVEVGVGVIPAGGGTKEMALRASDTYEKDEVGLPELQKRFLTIGQASVATSAYEAYDLGLLRKGYDTITINPNRVISDAKRAVVELAEKGYTQPIERKDIKVFGKSALGSLLIGVNSFKLAGYISQHDQKIAEKLARVICGGDLSQPSLVSEQYLLNLEREAFLSLCGERKTLERIQSILNTGKPLRN